jgi:hypothetical protein
MPAQRILTRPDVLADFLVDDDNRIGLDGVTGGEFASAKQWNSHRMKVAGIDEVNADEMECLAGSLHIFVRHEESGGNYR